LRLLATLFKRLRLALAMQMLGKGRPSGVVETIPSSGAVFDEALLRDLTSNFPARPPAFQPKNAVIMREGEAGIFMYVGMDGAGRITSGEKIIEVVKSGGGFGEMALVDQSKRAATAAAASDCNLMSINRNDFLTLIKTNPAFGVSLLRALATRLPNTGRKESCGQPQADLLIERGSRGDHRPLSTSVRKSSTLRLNSSGSSVFSVCPEAGQIHSRALRHTRLMNSAGPTRPAYSAPHITSSGRRNFLNPVSRP